MPITPPPEDRDRLRAEREREAEERRVRIHAEIWGQPATPRAAELATGAPAEEREAPFHGEEPAETLPPADHPEPDADAQPEPTTAQTEEPTTMPRDPPAAAETQKPSHRERKAKTAYRAPRQGWQILLKEDAGGSVRGNELNVGIALRHAPELVGKITFDVRRQAIVATKSGVFGPEGHWSSARTAALTAWLQGIGVPAKTGIVDNAIEALSLESRIDPLEDYLSRLRWTARSASGTG